jgi:hypothetical protein
VVLEHTDEEIEVGRVLKREVDDNQVVDREHGLRVAIIENCLPENAPIEEEQDDLLRDGDWSVEETDEGLEGIERIWICCDQTCECLEEGGVERICDPRRCYEGNLFLGLLHESEGLRRPGVDDNGIRVNIGLGKWDSRQLKRT